MKAGSQPHPVILVDVGDNIVDSSNPLPVNVVSGGSGGGGALGSGSNATAQRIVNSTDDPVIGATNETAPATDTAASGLNGRLQRVAQRVTSLIAALPIALGAGGGLKIDGSGTALPVSAASLPLPTGASTETTLAGLLTLSDFDTKVGSLTETAPASDTASSGLNGRLQRIAQRLSSLITALGTPFQAGGALGAGTARIGKVGADADIVGGNFTRPADTTAYASGDLVANSVTAGSVVPITITASLANDGKVAIPRVRLKKSNTSLTNASFRVHLYKSSPTCTNGDNGAWLTTESTYIGAFDVTMDRAFSDGAKGTGVPLIGNFVLAEMASGTMTIFALIEARAAYPPASAEVFTLACEVLQFS